MRVLVKFDALGLGPVDDHYSFNEIYNLSLRKKKILWRSTV